MVRKDSTSLLSIILWRLGVSLAISLLFHFCHLQPHLCSFFSSLIASACISIKLIKSSMLSVAMLLILEKFSYFKLSLSSKTPKTTSGNMIVQLTISIPPLPPNVTNSEPVTPFISQYHEFTFNRVQELSASYYNKSMAQLK